MLMVLHPTYTLRIVIKDRAQQQQSNFIAGGAGGAAGGAPMPFNPHKFYGGLNGSSGCDAALQAVRDALGKAGIPADVSLDRFEHTGG